MKTLKKILFLIPLALGTQLNAAENVGKKIVDISHKVKDLCTSPTIGTPPRRNVIFEKLSPAAKANCAKATDLGLGVGGIILNVEQFRTRSIATIIKKGDELNALLDCMNSIGSEPCKARKCASENDCISMICSTASELLQPIVNDLIAFKTFKKDPKTGELILDTNKQPIPEYKDGALLRLASLSIIPKEGAVAEKFKIFKGNIVKLAQNIDGAIAFLEALAIIISPKAYLDSLAQPTPEQQQQALTIEPVEIPKDETIDPNEGSEKPVEETF